MKRSGYISLRHNSLRDIIAKLLETAEYKDVTTEPPLLHVSYLGTPSYNVHNRDLAE